MLAEFIIGALGDVVVEQVGSKGFAWLKSRAAKIEIGQIAASAVEAGILVTPAIADDLRSESFARGVIVPMLEALIADPSHLPDPDNLAGQFVEMFVVRFATNEDFDETLRRIFQTNTSDLKESFITILTVLRSLLYDSVHWREMAHFMATETALSNTQQIISILNRQDYRRETDSVDLDAARLDARAGSEELRNWPRTIAGRELARSELNQLKSRILNEPSGATLLIGEAGSGKSALLARLTEELENAGLTVFGIKADTLPATIATFDDISRALGMEGALAIELSALALQAPVILILDQLDAVSDVMDRTSQRMKVLLRLVRHVRDTGLQVHIVVSSRPFEAAHDARFQQLRAETFKLTSPSAADVETFLASIGIDTCGIPSKLWDTLRRPFALKLFVDLVERGASPDAASSGSLLSRWLATADLGSDRQRRDVLKLMERLASEMLATETLWRPADAYEATHKEALARTEACGLIVRSGSKIGFCHQSWLDDFQARSFKSGNDLASYAWERQDSLFVRATVLRALERLRVTDPGAYQRAVLDLLWSDRTRRHLKHLVVDVIATAAAPSNREGAWIISLIKDDPILANRALGKIADRWSEWRGMIGTVMHLLMVDDQFHWRAIQLLAAEAKVDPDRVMDLIRMHWDDAEKDALAFRVTEQSGIITPAVEDLVRKILSRTAIDANAFAHFVKTLRKENRHREACSIVGLWFDCQKIDQQSTASLYGLGKLAEAAPLEFAEQFLPRFIDTAARQVGHYRDGYKRYPKSESLSWDFGRERDCALNAFGDAMITLAETAPSAALDFIRQLEGVEIDQVQDVIAQSFIASRAALASDALAFLLADERRLLIGDAHVTLEPGVSSMESGLTSQELIEAIAPHVSDDEVTELRDRIENWSVYASDYDKHDEPSLRFRRLKWANDHRMELLERLPGRLLTPRKRRQVREWRAVQHRPVPKRTTGRTMATFVGSPMSHEKMAKARDDDIFTMLDEIHDQATSRPRRRPLRLDGGVIELSRAFAEFAKGHPERAIDLCRTRFMPGRHEHAAAYMVDELSKLDPFPAERLLATIHELSRKGFSSRSWKTSASWALARLAGRLSGLPDMTIEMLESWLENHPADIANKIERRLSIDEENARRNKREKTKPDPIIFSSHFAGEIRIVPQDNYSVLDAIFHGLIGRQEQDYGQWLSVLERHARKPEDPHNWAFLLASRGEWLYWADRHRVQQLLTRLWRSDPRIFEALELGGLLWSCRAMFPDKLLIDTATAWSRMLGDKAPQAAGELAEAFHLVEPNSTTTAALAAVLSDEPSPELTGRLLTAASAWRESDAGLRTAAHSVLMEFVPRCDGDQAHAISNAVDKEDTLPPDRMTRELILTISKNEAALSASLTGRFADGLQSLLLYPGFDEPVMQVAERIVALMVSDKGRTGMGFMNKDFVQVAIALQRGDSSLRARAMDVYETLLDAGAYGAEEAARDVLSR